MARCDRLILITILLMQPLWKPSVSGDTFAENQHEHTASMGQRRPRLVRLGH